MKDNTLHPAMYWIHMYAYVVLAAAIYGILVAHIPVLLGHQWSVCLFGEAVSLPCVLTIHLFDATLTILTILFAWYSIKKASISMIRQYRSLLMVVIALELCFFTFECVELLWNFHNNAQAWENILIASIAVVLLGGVLIGVYVNLKVISLTKD